eukprot:gene5817-6058_t
MQLQVPRILPGPAGKLQQLAAAGELDQATPEALGLKCHTALGSQINSSRTPGLHDASFQSAAWQRAAAYAASRKCSSTGGSPPQLATIADAKQLSVGKVPQDPTGTIGAAVHSSVLQQQLQHDVALGPGCIALLQDVSVFTPTPGTSYIAITAQNINKGVSSAPGSASVGWNTAKRIKTNTSDEGPAVDQQQRRHTKVLTAQQVNGGNHQQPQQEGSNRPPTASAKASFFSRGAFTYKGVSGAVPGAISSVSLLDDLVGESLNDLFND